MPISDYLNLQNLPEITSDQLVVDQTEALRYLRHPKEPAPELAARLAEAAAAISAAAAPRYVVRPFPLVKPEGAPIRLQGAALQLPGRDIARLLQNADSCLLFAATIGAQVDELIRRAQIKDVSFALLLDACASCAVEDLCNQAQTLLAYRCAAGRRYLTVRFSPGYGDLPLTLQPQLCAALDATRRIGLTVSASGLLLPRKSVTAVIGIISLPQPNEPKQHNCAACNMADRCPYRQSDAACPKS